MESKKLLTIIWVPCILLAPSSEFTEKIKNRKPPCSRNTATVFLFLCFVGENSSHNPLKPVCETIAARRCICMCRGRCVDASLTRRGVRLTSCGGDVDVDADLRDASPLQRRHTSVRAKVGELEVYDVQVGGPGGDVGVCLGDDHALWAPQGTAILQPAESQLLWRSRLHLQRSEYRIWFPWVMH